MKKLFRSLENCLKKIPPELYIFLTVSLVPLFFLNTRLVRMAGDEKVYVAQAIEMARRGTWFFQSLAEIPYYYKGPFHYWFVLAGFKLFGLQLISSVYMHWLLLAIAAPMLYRTLARRYDSDKALLVTAMAISNVGLLSHAFASQMEVEVSVFYLFCFMALARLKGARGELLFWLSAGAVGWIKSPVHSFLIGASGLLYFTFEGTLLDRAKKVGFWLRILCGVAFCVLGYAPILLKDFDRFYTTFIAYEHMGRSEVWRGYRKTLEPLLHFTLPWTPIALLALFGFVRRFRSNLHYPYVRTAISLSLPVIVFWMHSPSQGQNYNLPSLALLLIALVLPLPLSTRGMRSAARISGAVGLVAAVALAMMFRHFAPMPEWYPFASQLLAVGAFGAFSVFFLFGMGIRTWMLGSAFFVLAFLSIAKPIGERELIGLRDHLAAHPSTSLVYYNSTRTIFAEWGLLELAFHRRVQLVQEPAKIETFFRDDVTIIAPYDEGFAEVHSKLDARGIRYEVTDWKRWWAKGKDEKNVSFWTLAYRARRFDPLERNVKLVRITAVGAATPEERMPR